MTLRPHDDRRVHGVEGPAYKVGPNCANPTCPRFADDPHHIWSRGKLGGPYDWVMFRGNLVANLAGLCARCHNAITGPGGGYRAAIRYDDEDDVFYWCDVTTRPNKRHEYHEVGPLDPQPPSPSSLATRASGHAHESTACPFCGQTRRRSSGRAETQGERRRRKTWNVLVPADEQENGAEVLDALHKDLAPLLGYGIDAGSRYYVLVPVLYYAQTHRRAFIKEISGVGA